MCNDHQPLSIHPEVEAYMRRESERLMNEKMEHLMRDVKSGKVFRFGSLV